MTFIYLAFLIGTIFGISILIMSENITIVLTLKNGSNIINWKGDSYKLMLLELTEKDRADE